MPEETNKTLRTKYAVGHYLSPDQNSPKSFRSLMKLYADRLLEVYFSWPTINNAHGWRYQMREKERLFADLKYCKEHGMLLDLLCNATCYAEKSFTREQRMEMIECVKELEGEGLRPDIVTTTSPYIAKVFKSFLPGIEVRASVNMRLRSTIAFEYLEELFDSYYICRDAQRDMPTILMFEKWCKEHDKKLCMLANSGCLRNCSFQVFHETLISHGFQEKQKEMYAQNFALACNKAYQKKQYVEIMRGSWIRPEDIHLWEPHVSTIKLATRDVAHPDLIMKSYLEESWDGNLLHILDPAYAVHFRPYIINNKKFPADWATSGIGGKCADNCQECGKCDEVLKQVLTNDIDRVLTDTTTGGKRAQYTFTPTNLTIPSRKGN